MPRSDRELMVASREGDKEAFRALHDRYARAILNWFNKQCYDRSLAEDLTQETFLRIWLARDRYRPEATFRTFLYTVARNLWIDKYRSRKSAPPTISADTRVAEDGARIVDLLPADGRDIVDSIADAEAVELVRAALARRPAQLQRPAGEVRWAAVSLVLVPDGSEGLDALLIRRAEREGDGACMNERTRRGCGAQPGRPRGSR